jgi:peptidyl-prolyl cis-trans isomerase SurA
LKETGDVSKPFKTAYGYNIIRLVEKLPVPSNEDDAAFESYLQTQVQNTGRLDAAKKNLVNSWLGITGFKEASYNKNDLWIYTDSSLRNNGKIFASYKAVKPGMVLFQFAGRKFTVEDWMSYLQSRDIFSREEPSSYSRQMNDFIWLSCNEYYRLHIEDFDSSISEQLKEFNEANMLFYIMDKHVWSKASNDTAGLKKYYELHKGNYTWQKSVTALVISAPGQAIADSIALKIKSNPSKWRSIAAAYNEVYADSSRFNVNELPVKAKLEYEANFQTLPESNEAGNVYTFVHVLSSNDKPEQKSFEEARGAVINDYQEEIEKNWIKDLKAQYPVFINEPVLKTLH